MADVRRLSGDQAGIVVSFARISAAVAGDGCNGVSGWTRNGQPSDMGGIPHFGILLASAAVPHVLDWRGSLAKFDELTRQLVWVHGVFIVLVIVGFGLLSVFFAADLASGTPLARAVCCFVACFWFARLLVQFFVFDAKPYLKTALLKVGCHGLTAVFAYHAVVYALAAILA